MAKIRYLIKVLAFAASLSAANESHAQQGASPYTSATRYDAMGRISGTIAPDPDGPGVLAFPATRNTYDEGGRLSKFEKGELSTWKDESVNVANWGGDFKISTVTEFKYDSSGRKIREILQGRSGSVSTLILVKQFTYDAVGRLECSVVRMNPEVYSALPDNACILTSPGQYGPDRLTRNIYDLAGQLLQVRKGVGTQNEIADATFTYDLNSNRRYTIDANGNKSEMRYDGFGRLQRWIFPAVTRPSAFDPTTPASVVASAGAVNEDDYEQYTYDANDNRLTLRKRDGSTIEFIYDALDRLVKKVLPTRSDLSPAATRDVYYAYDTLGRQTDARFDSLAGEGTHINYDGFGRPKSSVLSMDGVARTVWTEYDANNNKTKVTQSDGAYVRYVYDGLDRLHEAHMGWNGVSGETQFASINYATNGERTSISHGLNTSYDYDAAQRLLSLTHAFRGGAGNATESLNYNPASQISNYGNNNNAYSFKNNFNISRAFISNGLNQYSKVGGRNYCYDANGNLVADGSDVYLYDIENRLIQKRSQINTDCDNLSYSGLLKVSLRYDPQGHLYETVGNVTGTTRMIYDGDNLIAEYNGSGTLLRRYLWGDRVDEPLVWDEGGLLNCSGTHFLASNRQGSIVAAADCQANLTRIFAYDEYGLPSSSDSIPLMPQNGARFMYTGQAFQVDLGMYYYKARMYSPTLGRFMQVDPIGYDDQFNLYAYVGNDPVNNVDPSGQQMAPLLPPPPLPLPPAGPIAPSPGLEPPKVAQAPLPPTTVHVPEIVVTGVKGGIDKFSRGYFGIPFPTAAQNLAGMILFGNRPPNLTPSGAGRKGALREAKRKNNIPTSQGPKSQGPNYNKQGKRVSGKEYVYTDARGRDVGIRDDAGGHSYDDPSQNRGPHFNDPAGNHYDY